MSILDLLFPRRCVSCGKLGKYLCPQCCSIIRIIEQNQQVCPVCERPAINGGTHPRCQTKYSLNGLTSFFVYEATIKKAIKLLKYKFVTDLTAELFSLLDGRAEVACRQFFSESNRSLKEEKSYRENSLRIPQKIGRAPRAQNFYNHVLTPVPLHPSRLRWRGFNQAELLGKMISTRLNIRFIPDLLIRKKPTRPQVELKGKQRQENIVDAFVISPHVSISSPRIIVFDDVWTTGATLRTCGAVLKRAGAKSVWGLTIAR